MKLIEDIVNCRSVAIVGLAKNAGKTECLNYVLKKLHSLNHPTALSSIGLDGESVDKVSRTPKPEITIYKGMLFATSEYHYRGRRLTSEIIDIGLTSTALGRIVTAKAIIEGKSLISGPSATSSMRRLISLFHKNGSKTVLIDGALSRLSPASPAVADAMILSTGASVAASIREIVSHTKFICTLMQLPQWHGTLSDDIDSIKSGVWAIDSSENIHDLQIPSALAIEKHKEKLFEFGYTLYCCGAVSDHLLSFLSSQKQVEHIRLIVRDFTRIFASPITVNEFLRRGGQIQLLHRNQLLAVTVNPLSPKGFRLDSEKLTAHLRDMTNLPVYDLMTHDRKFHTVSA